MSAATPTDGGTNPRVAAWLTATGREPACIERIPGEGVRHVPTASGVSTPWTAEYMAWVLARWEEWARGLGFEANAFGSAAENARAKGHTHTAFDAWLAAYKTTDAA